LTEDTSKYSAIAKSRSRAIGVVIEAAIGGVVDDRRSTSTSSGIIADDPKFGGKIVTQIGESSLT
jgi:hypothetical protein